MSDLLLPPPGAAPPVSPQVILTLVPHGPPGQFVINVTAQRLPGGWETVLLVLAEAIKVATAQLASPETQQRVFVAQTLPVETG